MDNTKLLPCPFCGEEAKILVQRDTFQIVGCSDKETMLCPSPSIVVYEMDGKYDYKWWNRRK